MDYSSSNPYIWNSIVQFGIIAVSIIICHGLRRAVPAIRKTLMPTAVLAGFVLLALKLIGIIDLDSDVMSYLTYHCIAIGFIAMSLRVPERTAETKSKLTGLRSGAIIASSYMIQGATGLIVTIILSKTIMPDLFTAAGMLLPMGYGQGPGQANNIGSSYEALGFEGGRSFGLALAAAGYICACIVGIIYINVVVRKGKKAVDNGEVPDEDISVGNFQDKGELPISESLDRLSVQAGLIAAVYLLTYLVTKGVVAGLTAIAPGLEKTVSSLFWGFNFMIGSGLAIVVRSILKKCKNHKIMSKQYQNNYLLNRISGLAFDIMIAAGIASIDIEQLSGLWLPFIILAVLGGLVTHFHLQYVCKIVYPNYFHEGYVSMYGMMTGTISSGVLLLREIDPQLKSPAANNLVLGSSFAILFGAPILILVSTCTKSFTSCCVSLGIIIAYYGLMLAVIHLRTKKIKNESTR